MSTASDVTRPGAFYAEPKHATEKIRFPFLDFFAGSGLVSYALAPFFQEVWANDICPKKAAVFMANHANRPFALASVADVRGAELPFSILSWASFPCQDLSLAGNGKGIRARRSGLVWEWLRVMDEMPRRPPILAAENVVGLVSADGGKHYKELHNALIKRGYRVGAVLLDAIHWLPQSRPRIFIVAVSQAVSIPPQLLAAYPTWAHPTAVQKAAVGLNSWLWWNIPQPAERSLSLMQLIDFDEPCQSEAVSRKNLDMVPDAHKRRLQDSALPVVPGYKRIRQGKQVLELRFDGAAGCLRTPSGGSSRQYLVIRQGDTWRTRIVTPQEAARLMGAPKNFQLPGSFSDGYKAMGDAVAVPVARYLAKHLLSPLAVACNAQS